jgi:hypothetical protein
MKSPVKLTCLTSTIALLLAVPATAQSPPAFSPAVITGSSQQFSIALSGYNFGSDLCGGTRQDCAYFRIGNPTCDKTSPGECEAGYLGDADTVNFNSWTPNTVSISSYTVGQPGDAIEIGIWNQENQSDGTVWAGNISPVQSGTPQISSVVMSGVGKNLKITIYGSGFGAAPKGVPCTSGCDTAFLRFGDYAYHSFTGECGVCFYAGFTGSTITMRYSSWSKTKIELTGFAGTYSSDNMPVNHGDPVVIAVWANTNEGLLATAWSGTVP